MAFSELAATKFGARVKVAPSPRRSVTCGSLEMCLLDLAAHASRSREASGYFVLKGSQWKMTAALA